MPVINMPYNPLMLLPLPKVPPNVKRCHPSSNIKTNFFGARNLNKTNVVGLCGGDGCRFVGHSEWKLFFGDVIR